MHTRSTGNRALTVLLLVAFASASLAPVAVAGGRTRYKRPRPARHGVVRVVHRGPYIHYHRSEPGALAGFIGGLVVGTVLSNALPPAPPPPVYEYYDPYCHRNFVTVEAYDEHLFTHRHPRSAEVIEVHSGRCVDTMVWRDGRWCSRDDHPAYEEWDE
jgi:hypothetical protein